MTEVLSGDDFSIVICGEAGQGIDTISSILTKAFSLNGYNIFSPNETMSKIPENINSTEIIVSSRDVASFVNKIDVLVAFNKLEIRHFKHRLSPNTILFIEKENIEAEYISMCQIIDVPFSRLANEKGSKTFGNIIAAGLIMSMFKIDLRNIELCFGKVFDGDSPDIIEKNILVGKKGYAIGQELVESQKILFESNRLLEAKVNN